MPANSGGGRIALAAVAGAHGVKGEVRLKLFSDSADSLKSPDRLFVGGAARRLIAVRDAGRATVVHFEGINNRSAAEALRGALVEVDRSALPPLADGEYYHADLIGLPAVDKANRTIGVIVAVENFGAGDLLEIELKNGRKSLIPFKPDIADIVREQVICDPDFLA